jgi:hypothetical protein
MARYRDQKSPTQPYLTRVPGKPRTYRKNPDWDGEEDNEDEEDYVEVDYDEDDDSDSFSTIPLSDPDHDNFVAELALLDLYDNLMVTQDRLRDCRDQLTALLRQHPDLQERWAKFQRQGGATTKDLEDFFNGRFRPRITRTRRHLRLVSNRELIGVKLKRKTGNDDAA